MRNKKEVLRAMIEASKNRIYAVANRSDFKSLKTTSEVFIDGPTIAWSNGAEKVTPNMIPMDNPTEQEAKNLSSEFRQIFFAQ